MRPSLRLPTLGSIALVALAFAGCDDVVKDATFREWCGESLCQWTLEEGRIRKAATWHERDHGVEFVATPTTIAQTAEGSDHRCLEFAVIADVAPSAQMEIGLDFNADGTIDDRQPIVAVKFREVKTLVSTPRVYRDVRFVLSKKGQGRAVLAQMNVRASTECTAPPIELRDLPLGAPCAIDGDGAACRSGVCCDGYCSDCCVEKGSSGPDGAAVTLPGAACAPPGGRCAVRQASWSPWPSPRVRYTAPHQCDPGGRTRAPEEECLANDDCVSGSCVGASAKAARIDASLDGGFAACDGATFLDPGEGCLVEGVRAGRCR